MLVTAATAISIMIVTGNNRLTYGCTEVSGLTNRLEHPFSFCGELESIHTAVKPPILVILIEAKPSS